MGKKLAAEWLPFSVLLVTIVAVGAVLAVDGRDVSAASVYAVLEYVGFIGPVALGVGIALSVGQFDLSVGAMFPLAGIVAVGAGAGSWVLGLIVALAVAIGVGLVHGTLVERLRLNALAVTLGGYVALSGLAYVITHSKPIAYTNYEIGARLTEPIMSILSIRSLAALGCFALAGVVLRYTRVGRDLYAAGGNQRASRNLGLPVGRLVVGVLVASAALTALSGAMVSYALASASPENASNPLFPAVIAAVIGGVRLSGGSGTASGILAGVLTLGVIDTGLSVLAAPSYVSNLAYGVLLLAATVAAASDRAALRRGARRLALRTSGAARQGA